MVHETIHPAVFDELQTQFATLEQNRELVETFNFVAREEARRELKLLIIDRLDRLIDDADKGEKKRLRALKRPVLRLMSLFEQANEQLFGAYRAQMRGGNYVPSDVLERFSAFIEIDPRDEWADPPPYDHLDTLVDGLLRVVLTPRAQRQPDPEMVYYQPTPARIVVDMVHRLSLGPDDVFYDLGSGLGRAPILVALTSEARAKGVEIEPAYVAYAQRRVKDLDIPRVEFITADARDVRYADATVFFLYTPFKGKILQRVLELLRHEARQRRVRVCTYGPGTLEVMEQGWVVSGDGPEPDIHRVAILERTV